MMSGQRSKVTRKTLFFVLSLVVFFTLHPSPFTLAQNMPSSGELIVKCWDAHGKKDIENTAKFTDELIQLYQDEADKQQASIKSLPKNRTEIEALSALNDVATAYFIQGESYRDQDKREEAIAAFQIVVDKYYFGQAWDPRGWFWQVAKAAEESIDKLRGVVPPVKVAPTPKVSQLATKIVLHDPGKEDIVDYPKYGEFKYVGTEDYKYIIKDQAGLMQAAGEGIYPNDTLSSIRFDPEFQKAKNEGRLAGAHWDFVHSPDLQAAFFKWVLASEPRGVKLFYIGLLLEKSGLIKHAIRAYYAIIVHFPGAYGWTYWHTPWSVGQASIAKIEFLLRRNPELGYRLADADIRIINGFDNDISNDIVITNPGRFEKISLKEKVLDKLKPRPGASSSKIKRQLGKGRVHLVQYESGGWQLLVEGRPYMIKGITYAPTKVGQSPDAGTLGNWMEEDFNKNNRIDGPYDAFVDKNRNNWQDKDEPAIGDFQLLKEMGVNTIRLYHHPLKINKELMRELYNKYGIRVILGDFLGKYAIGSGAPWNPGTDYNNEEQKRNMMQSAINMVLEHKDEPYCLFWLLGNENVYGYACNADKEPDAFFSFANEVAQAIKRIDPEHPVAIASGDILFLDKFAKDSADIDIFGANAYRGDYGFGYFWRQVKKETDKPALITEFGCPAYAEGKTSEEAEALQAEYHRAAWEDIMHNSAFGVGAGNAIGGIVFEWLDEWWKGYEPSTHDTKGLWIGPFPDGSMHEEWLGVTGQGDAGTSPFLRQLRKSYYMYKQMWK